MNRILYNEDEDQTVDEIVVENCTVHVEQMSDCNYWMSVTLPDGQSWDFDFHSKRKITFKVSEQAGSDFWDEIAHHG